MPKKVITRTGVPGGTPEQRKMLDGVDATTPEPTAVEDGELLNRNEFIHFLFRVDGVDPVFSLQIWWYSYISGEWHRGEALTVNNHDLVTIEVQGLDRVYLEVLGVTGTGIGPWTLDAWLALVVPV